MLTKFSILDGLVNRQSNRSLESCLGNRIVGLDILAYGDRAVMSARSEILQSLENHPFVSGLRLAVSLRCLLGCRLLGLRGSRSSS